MSELRKLQDRAARLAGGPDRADDAALARQVVLDAYALGYEDAGGNLAAAVRAVLDDPEARMDPGVAVRLRKLITRPALSDDDSEAEAAASERIAQFREAYDRPPGYQPQAVVAAGGPS